MGELQEKYRYNPFFKYGKQLENIISKKQYNPKLANMLRLSFPIMIEYYGHEYSNILFETLQKISIDIPENGETMFDIVQKHTPTNIEKRSKANNVNKGELRRASGVHSVNPLLKIVDGKIELIGKSEIVSIKTSPNPLNNLATFVHELSHAFKSNRNSMSLLQNRDGKQILVNRSGISVTYSIVYIENEKIIIEDIKEKNLGLEEGINTLDENNIINKILTLSKDDIPIECHPLKDSLVLPNSKSEYISDGYRQETLCADKLMKKCKLENIVRQDQFIGTSKSENAYNEIALNTENNWKSLNAGIDTSVKHTYARFQHIGNKNWFQEHKDEIIANLQNVHNMLNESAQNVEENYLSI